MGTCDCGDEHDHGDVMDQGLEFAGRMLLERMAEEGQWGQAPQVILATHSDVTADAMPEEIRRQAAEDLGVDDVSGLALALAKMPIPDELWDGTEPFVVLEWLADDVFSDKTKTRVDKPEGLRVFGIMIIAEAFMVMRPDDPPPGWAERAEEFASEGKLRQHPDAVEQRLLFTVDTAGQQIGMRHPRGSDEIVRIPSDAVAGGRVVEALSRILAAVTDDLDDELARFTQE